MSLYGRVKRVDSSPFQFDRVYPNRTAMEEAQNTDGVFVGRYILVEYGERYVPKKENNEFVYDDKGEKVLIENPNYTSNKETDKNKYGDTYDSTVWIKIYSGSDEKYVMVAELNAFAPQLELKPEGALLYKRSDNDNNKIITWNAEENKPIEIKNAIEELRNPYFDLTRNSEVSYDLHMPGPLNLNVNNDNLNFGQELNNIVYGDNSKLPSEQNNYVGWTSDDVQVDANGVVESIGESKTLRLNFEALGYALKDLYDLLYGKPNGENNDWVRPFFKEQWAKANETPDSYYKDPDNDSGNLNKLNDNLNWVKTLGDMVNGNDKGLAGIIEDLFASRNPLTGKVIYYLLNAWNLNYIDENQKEQPNISGKPDVITAASYKTTTTDEVTVREFTADEGATVCQYGIDYNTWTLTPII